MPEGDTNVSVSWSVEMARQFVRRVHAETYTEAECRAIMRDIATILQSELRAGGHYEQQHNYDVR